MPIPLPTQLFVLFLWTELSSGGRWIPHASGASAAEVQEKLEKIRADIPDLFKGETTWHIGAYTLLTSGEPFTL